MSLWVQQNKKRYCTFYRYIGSHDSDEEFQCAMEKHFNYWIRRNIRIKLDKDLIFEEIINYLETNFDKLEHGIKN